MAALYMVFWDSNGLRDSDVTKNRANAYIHIARRSQISECFYRNIDKMNVSVRARERERNKE